jgi:hypothetical protein
MEKQLAELKNNQVKIQTDISYIKDGMKEIKDCIKEDGNRFITVNRFKPVELLAYGFAALFLSSVVIALLAQVVVAFDISIPPPQEIRTLNDK